MNIVREILQIEYLQNIIGIGNTIEYILFYSISRQRSSISIYFSILFILLINNNHVCKSVQNM